MILLKYFLFINIICTVFSHFSLAEETGKQVEISVFDLVSRPQSEVLAAPKRQGKAVASSKRKPRDPIMSSVKTSAVQKSDLALDHYGIEAAERIFKIKPQILACFEGRAPFSAVLKIKLVVARDGHATAYLDSNAGENQVDGEKATAADSALASEKNVSCVLQLLSNLALPAHSLETDLIVRLPLQLERKIL